MTMRGVMLLPSNDVVWLAIRSACEQSKLLQIVGEARTMPAALRLMNQCGPHLILASDALEDGRLVELLRKMEARSVRQHPVIYVISNAFDPDELAKLAEMRVRGYLLSIDLQSDTLPVLIELLVTSRLRLTSSSVAESFLEQCHVDNRPASRQGPFAPIERAVLRVLAEGNSTKEAAAILGVSEHTVYRLVAKLRLQFDVPTTFALGVRAARLGLVD